MAEKARTMNAVFVDDGAPDAAEFDTNYIWFDTSDPSAQQRAWAAAERLWEERTERLRNAGSPVLLRRPTVRRYERSA